MMTSYEIRLRVEEERQLIIRFLEEKDITHNSNGERVDALPLLPLTIMRNNLLVDSN
ncbi:hypothetical protein [Bacillus sp. AFS040349]|uniref:hypothetical protein n=1 Tax=Bacillus sp. AFS040349 TaxID=2033502 RepID=UPI00159BEF01|nr:hypothetical protein [Bacillus sp. AFS040349]